MHADAPFHMAALVVGRSATAERITEDLASVCVVQRAESVVDGLAAEAPSGLDVVVVVGHDDLRVVRDSLALSQRHDSALLVATVFDRTIGNELMALLPRCVVVSPADVVAPRFAETLLWDQNLADIRRRSLLGLAMGQLRPHDGSTRLLFAGLLGLLTTLLGETVLWLRQGVDLSHAFHASAFIVGGVEAPPDDPGGRWFLWASSGGVLAGIVFAAAFTAGAVERMLSSRHVALVGKRVLPRRGHVIVVGLGQIGYRLCVELQRHGVGVVGVERDPSAHGVALARRAGVPVVISDGTERAVLNRVLIERSLGLAIVGSSELDNLAVAVASRGVTHAARVVLRCGDSELAIGVEEFLKPVAHLLDVPRLTASEVAAVVSHHLSTLASFEARPPNRASQPPPIDDSFSKGSIE